jgi:hypothetical protein
MGTDPVIRRAIELLNSNEYSTVLAGSAGRK